MFRTPRQRRRHASTIDRAGGADPFERFACAELQALQLATDTGATFQQARAHHGPARAFHASDEHADAGAHWRAAHQIYRELGVPVLDELVGEIRADATTP